MSDTPLTIAKFPARRLVLIGICLTVLGVLSTFQLERHSFESTSDFEFSFLEFVFLPALFLGLAAALIGSVLWARRAAVRDVCLWGLGVLIVAPLSIRLLPINIHGWTAMFLLVGLGAMLIGGLLLVFAEVRALIGLRRGPTPD